LSVSCPKCAKANADATQFCTQCHFPLRFTCPSCANVQRQGGACERCGVDFLKYGMMAASQLKLQLERDAAKRLKQTTVFREVLVAIATGGLSLLKRLRARR
jgi:hypothetical protein